MGGWRPPESSGAGGNSQTARGHRNGFWPDNAQATTTPWQVRRQPPWRQPARHTSSPPRPTPPDRHLPLLPTISSTLNYDLRIREFTWIQEDTICKEEIKQHTNLQRAAA